jgi:hypothetical protein
LRSGRTIGIRCQVHDSLGADADRLSSSGIESANGHRADAVDDPVAFAFDPVSGR